MEKGWFWSPGLRWRAPFQGHFVRPLACKLVLRLRLPVCSRRCQGALLVEELDHAPCGSCRTREKILEGWKVYAGTSNLLQLPEAASISQIIINGNYTDEEDDYDIALLRLSKPLTLSGES